MSGQERKYIILSPHVDDEVIGCYTYLKNNLVTDVYYFYELTDLRAGEATRAATKYNFTPHYNQPLNNIPADAVILLPSIKDSHPHHKMVNRLGNKLPNAKLYYSVDLDAASNKKVLSAEDQANKLNDLNILYTSQETLFQSDQSYSLFECITPYDTKRFVWVTFKKEGIHCYPTAPEAVRYLRNQHRHMFHFKISIEVFHDDRDIEFIMFKNELHDLYKTDILQLNNKSCEMVAVDIENYILEHYSGRAYSVDVSEDDENGAVL